MKSFIKPFAFFVLYIALVLSMFGTENTELLLVVLCFSLTIPIFYLMRDRHRQQREIALLNQETLKSELSLLKSQINPHFFFNTLNNLYGLAAEKSEKTEEVIYKLSEMMRFTIYDGRKDSVSIGDELNYLKNFIELNQLRYKSAVDLRFETQIEDLAQRIPPLLFINLLENAFKHGAETLTSGAVISIDFKTSAELIEFRIENNVGDDSAPKKSGGIGIENLKRRLELLFPKRHTYRASREGDSYIAEVRIELK